MIIKKVVVALTMISVMAACNSNPKVAVAVIDTTAIKQKAVLDEQAKVKTEDEARQKLAQEKRAEQRRENAAAERSSNVGSSATPVNSGSGNGAEAAPAPAPAKKGWSSAAKSTVIGGAAGAIAGGIIGHNLGGAAIGAAVGGGTGYLIGRAKDRKSGRVVKKVKAVDTTNQQ